MVQTSIALFFIVGLAIAVLLAIVGIDDSMKVDAKKKKEAGVKGVDEEIQKLEDDLRKIRADKSKPIKSSSKDIKKLRENVDKLDQKGWTFGQAERFNKVKSRLAVLENHLE